MPARPVPDSALLAAGHRLRLAAASRRRMALKGDPIAAALRSTALDRLSSPEREWSARIEARRLEVADLDGRRTPAELGVFGAKQAVQWMSVPPVLGRLLLRLVCELRPRSCFELGTGFGISGAYLAAGLELNGAGRLVSVDVKPQLARIAAEGFQALGLERVSVHSGSGEAVLDAAISEAAPIEFAFLDADHREAATVAALDRILPHAGPGAVIVLDDVAARWAGMGRAWRRVESDPRIAASRHLGRFGLAIAV